MKRNILLKIAVSLAYISMIAVNALANIIPFNNITTGEVSDSYPNLFAPAPVTFAIWGIIYLLLAGYIFYQFKQTSDKKRQILFEKISIPFLISSIANTLWIFAWHYNYILLSLLLMLIVLLCLIKIAMVLKKQVLVLEEKIFVKLPFSVYFGWITVATIANVVTLLVNINWDGFGLNQETWMVIVLFVGAIIFMLKLKEEKDIAYSLVLIWAYLGILIKHNSPLYFAGEYPLVTNTLIILISLFVLALISSSLNLKTIYSKKFLKRQ